MLAFLRVPLTDPPSPQFCSPSAPYNDRIVMELGAAMHVVPS